MIVWKRNNFMKSVFFETKKMYYKLSIKLNCS
jgi:hypothetical protein